MRPVVSFERGRTPDDFFADLQAAGELRWVAQRLPALEATLRTAAGALWNLAEAGLEPLEAEPDFLRGVAPPDEV